MAKIPLEKIIPTWGTPLKLHSDQRTHFASQVLQQVRAIGWFHNPFPCAYYPQSSASVEQTNGTVKTQLAKSEEIFQIRWPKALPLVLSLRSTLSGTRRLSPFEVVTGRPMHLAPASSDPQLTKGDTYQYCKGLTASLK